MLPSGFRAVAIISGWLPALRVRTGSASPLQRQIAINASLPCIDTSPETTITLPEAPTARLRLSAEERQGLLQRLGRRRTIRRAGGIGGCGIVLDAGAAENGLRRWETGFVLSFPGRFCVS